MHNQRKNQLKGSLISSENFMPNKINFIIIFLNKSSSCFHYNLLLFLVVMQSMLMSMQTIFFIISSSFFLSFLSLFFWHRRWLSSCSFPDDIGIRELPVVVVVVNICLVFRKLQVLLHLPSLVVDFLVICLLHLSVLRPKRLLWVSVKNVMTCCSLMTDEKMMMRSASWILDSHGQEMIMSSRHLLHE